MKNALSKTKIFTICTLAIAILSPQKQAWATFVTPKRVIIEQNQNTDQIIINNTSDKSMVYRFDWELRAQSPTGETLILKEGETTPGYKPAHPFIRFSPRQIILKPGEHQKIRFLLRRTADMTDGEYHSHFLIQPTPLEQKEDQFKPQTGGGISGEFAIRTNISIPVFVRHGETTLNAKIANATLYKKDGADFLRVNYTNNSTRSAYYKSVIECHNGSDDIKTRALQQAKLYTEAKSAEQSLQIPTDFSVDNCANIKFKIYATNDIELKRGLVDSIDVSRQ